MMYLCTDKCGKTCTETFHIYSYGKCEGCGKVRECIDCSPWHKRKIPRKKKPRRK
jgi:hypothetical protein